MCQIRSHRACGAWLRNTVLRWQPDRSSPSTQTSGSGLHQVGTKSLGGSFGDFADEWWCGEEDSNLHGPKPTSPSSWRVYQFRHRRMGGSRLILADCPTETLHLRLTYVSPTSLQLLAFYRAEVTRDERGATITHEVGRASNSGLRSLYCEPSPPASGIGISSSASGEASGSISSRAPGSAASSSSPSGAASSSITSSDRSRGFEAWLPR